jgi:hypothetical protein
MSFQIDWLAAVGSSGQQQSDNIELLIKQLSISSVCFDVYTHADLARIRFWRKRIHRSRRVESRSRRLYIAIASFLDSIDFVCAVRFLTRYAGGNNV